MRLIVPFAPGGADVPARMLVQRLGEKMGQPFVVDNREIVALLATQSLRDQLATVGVVTETGTPQQLASFMRSEMEKWSGVMKYAGLKKERY